MIFKLYRSGQFQRLRKSEFPEKTTDLSQFTDKTYHIMSYREARESLHIGRCKIILDCPSVSLTFFQSKFAVSPSLCQHGTQYGRFVMCSVCVLFVLFSLFFWPLCCLSLLDLRFLVGPFGIFNLFLSQKEYTRSYFNIDNFTIANVLFLHLF